MKKELLEKNFPLSYKKYLEYNEKTNKEAMVSEFLLSEGYAVLERNPFTFELSLNLLEDRLKKA